MPTNAHTFVDENCRWYNSGHTFLTKSKSSECMWKRMLCETNQGIWMVRCSGYFSGPFSQCLRTMLYLMNACQLDRDRHIPLIRFTVGFGVLILQGLCFFIRATNHEFVNQSMSSSVTWQLNHKARVDTLGYATGKQQSDHQTCQSPLHHLHTQCLSKDWWILWDQICLTYNLSPFFKGIF